MGYVRRMDRFHRSITRQGADVDEIDMYARACGVTVPGRAPVATHLHEDERLARWRAELQKRAASHWREIVPYPLVLPRTGASALPSCVSSACRTPRAGGSQHLTRAGHTPAAAGAGDLPHLPPLLGIHDKAWQFDPRHREIVTRSARTQVGPSSSAPNRSRERTNGTKIIDCKGQGRGR